MTFSCAIIFKDTMGLRTDAVVLTNAIRAALPDAMVVHMALQGRFESSDAPVTLPPDVRSHLPLDAVFLLEHAHRNPPFLSPDFAKRVIYVPNIEWMTPRDEAVIAAGHVDTVLFKTSFSQTIFEELPIAKQVRQKTLSGWTSVDVGLPVDLPVGGQTGPVEHVLHVRGTSAQKHTTAVIAAWLKNATFPRLDVIASFNENFSVPVPLSAAPNLAVHLRTLPEPELRTLQMQARIHLCPSIAEGFGHVLNEARATGAVLITVDAPPMNELVENDVSGILIPVPPVNMQPFRRSQAFPTSIDDIENAVRRALALSHDQRTTLGLRARAAFERDRQQFHRNISTLLAPSAT